MTEVGIAVTIGLTELIKRAAPALNGRWYALIALVVGIGTAFLWQSNPESYRETVQTGIVIGLASAGLYSGAKAVAGK